MTENGFIGREHRDRYTTQHIRVASPLTLSLIKSNEREQPQNPSNIQIRIYRVVARSSSGSRGNSSRHTAEH